VNEMKPTGGIRDRFRSAGARNVGLGHLTKLSIGREDDKIVFTMLERSQTVDRVFE
jgi:hypothetical protein